MTNSRPFGCFDLNGVGDAMSAIRVEIKIMDRRIVNFVLFMVYLCFLKLAKKYDGQMIIFNASIYG